MRRRATLNNCIYIFLLTSFLISGTDGTIRGKILDIEGNTLPGAQVYITELGVGTMADPDGIYLLLNIQVGEYDVTASMIGYSTQIVTSVGLKMDQTVWLNFAMEVAAIEGDVIFVSAERALVEKNETSKKITMGKELIDALPVRDVTELYSLQSGVVKVESRQHGIPDHAERGLVEMHVRGGRSGEVAYMIDGMYIRNPIFGGIGSGTRLNLLAIKEFDWQPGGFNAEYGDAMSAVSNWHTSSGSNEFKYRMSYKTSLVGALLGNPYDELRGYNDYNLGFGGKLPVANIYYWFSGERTTQDSYSVYEFDEIVYDFDTSPWKFSDAGLIVDNSDGDPLNTKNKNNLVQPWDTESGFRGFGFSNTEDYFAKLTFSPISQIKLDFSYWVVENHLKTFNPTYLFWDDGQGELFRDTERMALSINHTLSSKSFYTLRASKFTQDQFQGVRWKDTDSDGYPDWFEWRNPAGNRSVSDINNPYIVPYTTPDDNYESDINYTQRDYKSGWYWGADPGLYNWDTAEDFIDKNGNGLYDEGVDVFDGEIHDRNSDGIWDGPIKTTDAYYRDGSFWLYPEMYESYADHLDNEMWYDAWYNDPLKYAQFFTRRSSENNEDDPYYFLPNRNDEYWSEGSAFGGHDRFFNQSSAITNEVRLDFTSQLTNQLKIRTGVDYKSHKLNFYEVVNPWDISSGTVQTFAEHWFDDGVDQLNELDVNYLAPDTGENNGKYDAGEKFSDFNNNGKWDDFVEPKEIAFYLQSTYELPWMVINSGVRADGVNYNTKVYATPEGQFSPNKPWFYIDCGNDNICPGDGIYTPNEVYDSGESFTDTDGNGAFTEGEPYTDGVGADSDGSENNDIRDYNEITTAVFGVSSKQKPIFMDSEWLFKFSPRLGISHVITDQATFIFNYGLYYQTPTYNNIFMNINRQVDPEELFEESSGVIGNGTMTASRTQSYEFGFNIQINRSWAFSLMGWVKDMDQLVTSKHNRSGVYTYQVLSNGDYGTAKGIDFTLENRGMLVNTMLQYTMSQAKANGAYDWSALDNLAILAPSQEYVMPFDRTHNLVATFYTKLPFGINAGMTYSFQSGSPYTPIRWNGENPESDEKNKYSLRSPDSYNTSLSLSKFVKVNKMKIRLGLDIYNLLDTRNAVDVWPITGEAGNPGTYYSENIGLPYMVPDVERAKSSSYYDQPWMFSSPREVNFFIRFDFN